MSALVDFVMARLDEQPDGTSTSLTRPQADAFVGVINASWNTHTMRTQQALIVAQLWDDHEDFRPEWKQER